MNVHVFQHASFEDVGSIGSWLEARGATIRRTRLYAGESMPDLRGIDLLIAMGGPMSVNDEAALPWLAPEKQAVRDAIAANVRVLGVCLGSQLIASALGARVHPNPVREIGWYPIQAVPAPPYTFRFPGTCDVMHWHGETFDLPPGAVPLARSVACEHQAFQIGRHVIGLQFHLELTADKVRDMVEHCRADLVPGPYVQTEDELLAVPPARYQATNALMDDVLTYLSDSRGSG